MFIVGLYDLFLGQTPSKFMVVGASCLFNQIIFVIANKFKTLNDHKKYFCVDYIRNLGIVNNLKMSPIFNCFNYSEGLKT